MQTSTRNASLVSLFALVLAACGGGSDTGGSAPAPAPAPGGSPPPVSSPPPAPAPAPAPAPSPTDAQRIAAATTTAQGNSLCTAVQPFYWEIGDRNAALASASVGAAPPTGGTPMSIASASKWVYGAYVAQVRGGVLTAADVQFLTLRSGYTNLVAGSCALSATVDTCLGLGSNGVQDPAKVGFFFYNGGHMQRHAHDNGLGGMTTTALAAAVQAQIGNFGFEYSSPEIAGGIFASAGDYAGFLRKMLAGNLALAGMLGSNAVCTNPTTCASALVTPPVPLTESWHYSLGHWVEDDPAVGDGAFSSPGAFGFYPWIDRTGTWYGVLARESFAGEQGIASVQCGRLIRKAWVTGVAQ